MVLDAYSIIAYLEREPGYETVKNHLEHAARTGGNLLLCAVNWGEVYYSVIREAGQAKADETARVLETLPIDVVPADLPLTRQAAIYKASHKMSYADCFAAALARYRRATLLTGDREFKELAGEIRISWLT